MIGPGDCVLLFQYEDEGRRWWATPGGGLEGNETFERAAAREAAEELGLQDLRLVPLWCLTAEFTFRGELIRQVERYFLAREPRSDVAKCDVLREGHRLEGIVAARWWSLAELESTSEQVFPRDLSERLRALEV